MFCSKERKKEKTLVNRYGVFQINHLHLHSLLLSCLYETLCLQLFSWIRIIILLLYCILTHSRRWCEFIIRFFKIKYSLWRYCVFEMHCNVFISLSRCCYFYFVCFYVLFFFNFWYSEIEIFLLHWTNSLAIFCLLK